MNAPPTSRGRHTKTRILETTADLIRESGVAATTLDAVERACGVGRSQLYYYFSDRADLLRQVAAHSAHPLVERTTQALGAQDVNVVAIEQWFAMMVDANEATGGIGGCPLGSLVGQLAEHDEQARLVLRDAFEQWQHPLRNALQSLQKQAALRDTVDVGALADQIMAAIQGGLLLAQVRRDPDQLRRALAGARRLLHDASLNAA